jgi:hypothetical protein
VTAPARDDRQQEWSAADEAWFARLLAAWPPLAAWQRDRLRKLLDLSDGHDGTP